MHGHSKTKINNVEKIISIFWSRLVSLFSLLRVLTCVHLLSNVSLKLLNTKSIESLFEQNAKCRQIHIKSQRSIDDVIYLLPKFCNVFEFVYVTFVYNSVPRTCMSLRPNLKCKCHQFDRSIIYFYTA